jgi:hypothetical protein
MIFVKAEINENPKASQSFNLKHGCSISSETQPTFIELHNVRAEEIVIFKRFSA